MPALDMINGAIARLAAGAALVASIATPAVAQTIAITGGRVFPVSGPVIESGTVLIRDGRIVAVGADVAVPADARRVDATGKWVTPGLLDAATHLGVVEIGAVGETRDFAARGRDAIAAAFRVADGLNPRSVLIDQAREGGVTSVLVLPAGGLVAGQAAVIDLLEGADATEMIVRSPVAMVAQLESPQAAGTGARGELLLRMRELLDDVRAYSSSRRAFESGNTREFIASRADLEAMIPVLEGRLPLIVAADRASDIQAVLRLAKEYGLKVMIAGGAEAWMVASELAAANVPVLTGSLTNIPYSFAMLGSRQENPALLRRSGVSVLLTGEGGSDAEAFNVRNIRYAAGNAVAYGMSWDDALRSLTLEPARAFGLGDRVGTLAPGLVANVVVWSGDPFEFSSSADHVFVRGQEITTPSRAELLEQRYRTLPPDYRGPTPP
ncbi:MAG TPA: amidohydrolase family protein [Gemmatimonadales bacterium]